MRCWFEWRAREDPLRHWVRNRQINPKNKAIGFAQFLQQSILIYVLI